MPDNIIQWVFFAFFFFGSVGGLMRFFDAVVNINHDIIAMRAERRVRELMERRDG